MFTKRIAATGIGKLYESIFFWPQILYKQGCFLRGTLSFWGQSCGSAAAGSGRFWIEYGEVCTGCFKPALQPVIKPL
jgi:hypothetical protein